MINIFMVLNAPKDIYLPSQAKNYLDKSNILYNFDYYNFNLEENWANGPSYHNFFKILSNYIHKRDLLTDISFINMEYCIDVLYTISSLKKYDLYCFSSWDNYVDIQLLMALHIKKYNPTAKILFGGPDIILHPFLGEILKKIGFDYSLGDIDISLYDYINNYSNFYNKKHIQKMNLLFSNDVPKYSQDELAYLNNNILISTSRGCANNCKFCSSPALSPYSYVDRNVIRDWFRYYNNIGVTICSTNDSTLNKIDFDILLDGLVSINNKIIINGSDISFRDLEKHHIYKMKEAGFKYVHFGFECLHPTLQKNINKKMPPIEDIFRYLEEFNKHKIEVKLFYIAGVPTQTDKIFYDELEVIEYIDKQFNNVHFEFYDYFVSALSYIDKYPDDFYVKKYKKFSKFIDELPMFKNEILEFKTGITNLPSREKTLEYMKELYSKVNNKTKMKYDDQYRKK